MATQHSLDLRKSALDISLSRIRRLSFRFGLRVQAGVLTLRDRIAYLAHRALHMRSLPASIRWRIEGPFDSSYSLALVNRETALALEALGHRVALHSTEGPGDFEPDPTFLKENPDLKALNLRARQQTSQPHVISRNLYPPRVHDMSGRIRCLHAYAWEETGFPASWVDSFNHHLDSISVVSNHTRKILIDNGVTVPITVTGLGTDHWTRIKAHHPSASQENASPSKVNGKAFRFLHVSSCFARKGVDCLLEAYGEAFRDSDNVSLIIKTFQNPHNQVHTWLAHARARYPQYPHVEVIEGDLSDGDLKNLFEQCHVLVNPSRAEGLCLPLAECILSGLSVITTNWGGQTDFCDESVAWMVDYTFEQSRSHLGLPDSVWAEPDIQHLASVMRQVYETPFAERDSRIRAAQARLQTHWRWDQMATRLTRMIRHRAGRSILTTTHQTPRIGWITTWNTMCGIATYSEHLVRQMRSRVTLLAAKSTQTICPDTRQVQRCWVTEDPANPIELRLAIRDRALNTLVLQFNYGLFDFAALSDFLNQEIDSGRIIIIMMHATIDPAGRPDKQLNTLIPVLSRCDRVLVHSIHDLNRLKKLGLVNNVMLFPHGVLDCKGTRMPAPAISHQSVIQLATYGFCLPHKGLLEMIEVVALLRQRGVNVKLDMVNARYPVQSSSELIQAIHTIIATRGLAAHISLHDAFLSDEQCLKLLSDADLIVYPYQVSAESASGAVRYGLATGRAVAVTPLPIFDDIAPYVSKLPGSSPEQMAKGIAEIIDTLKSDPTSLESLNPRTQAWREGHGHAVLAKRLDNLIKSLLVNRTLS